MPENDPNNQCAAPGVPPIDLQLISQAVVSLHIARRTLLIYPSTHEQVKASLRRAHRQLSKVLSNDGDLSLTVMKDGLGVGGQRLQTTNPVFKDLSGVLKHRQVAMVTFARDLDINQLARFLHLITLDREKLNAHGGVVAVAKKRELTHIHIKAVDYSQLQLTEEQEIQRSDGEEDGGGSIWQQFTMQLVSSNAQVDASTAELEVADFDPVLLARLLNNRQVDARQALDGYQSLFSQADGAPMDTQPLTDGLIKFQQMIKDLNPELQEQFLSATFKNFARTATPSDTANLIDGLGGELILRMLIQADGQGEKISPSLLAFVQKMGQVVMPGQQSSAEPGPTEAAQAGFTNENVASLLAREQHEVYVDEGYSNLLNSLTAQASQETAFQDFAQEVDAALTDSQINIHTGRAMTRLMANSPDTSGYRNWARQVSYLLDDLLESRSFGYLTELLVLMRNEQHGCDDERAKVAKLVLDRFSDPQLVADAVQKARRPDGGMVNDALSFLIELGESVAAEVLEDLDPVETFSGHAFYEKLLENLGAVTAKEALARLKDPRPEYVQRMIRIIRRVGDDETVAKLKPMLDHESIDVRMEVLSALLKVGNNWGVIWLRKRLGEPWSEDARRAVLLAGRYRVREVVPELIRFVDRRGDMDRRKTTVQALGQIGDPAALSAFNKLARQRWSLAKKQTLQLKQVMYDNLDGFDYSDIKALLHLGMKHKDPAIRSACERRFKLEGRRDEAGHAEDNAG